MSIHIYNSLTRKKEEFRPLKEPEVKMYVCGPTVYDSPHIGHIRSAYTFSVIRRYLEFRGYTVKFVRNVTDVDDKIIDKAKKEFKGQDLNSAVSLVANKYLEEYTRDMQLLGIAKPDDEPKATAYIPKMIEFIAELIKRGTAYVADGDVYFDITKDNSYGKLSHQSLDKMEIGARVAIGENKKNPLDFALWKKAKEGEPSWDSHWGKGRPGWHVECSVMSSDILGPEFDIHGGGLDLIFPHHENEIAQSEAAGEKFARYWIHHGLLTINGQKMAKSLGNFITLDNFLQKYSSVDALKVFFLATHYAHPVDYTDKKIEEAREALERIRILMEKIELRLQAKGFRLQDKEIIQIKEIEDKFIAAMDDDFNTPQGLACIFDLVNLTNKNIDNLEFISYAKITLKELLDIFGIMLEAAIKTLGIPEAEINLKILERNNARKRRDFKVADAIRKELEDKGIILEDTKEETAWRRKL